MSTHHLFRTGTRLAPLALLSAGILGISTAAAGLTTGTLAQAPDHPFPGTSAACDKLIANQTSLGGVASSMESRWRWEGDRIPRGLLRLSVGLEDVEALWADLESALDHAAGA